MSSLGRFPSLAGPLVTLVNAFGGSTLSCSSVFTLGVGSTWSIQWWWDRHPFIPQVLLRKHDSPRWPSLRHLKHSLCSVATSHLSFAVIFLKFSHSHKPWCSLHSLHFFVGFFLELWSSSVKKVLSLFVPSLRTPALVSEAAIMNSDSRSINSLNAFTSSLVLLSQIHCLYFARRFLLNLRWSVM